MNTTPSDDIDYGLKKGDFVCHPRWWDGKRTMQVVDVNWALGAIALRLIPNSADNIVIWRVNGIKKCEPDDRGWNEPD